jgi:hypothetical protein
MNVRFSFRALAVTLVVAAGLAAALHGCADPNPKVIYLGGSGGTTSMGSGGVTSRGGVASAGTGGAVGSGGMVATGGTAATGSGGASATGGSAGGSATGGAATGGAAAGAPGSGGVTPAGGATGTGGATPTGGASGGPNLITNGDFSMGDMMWSVDNSSVGHQVTNGQFCLMVSNNTPSFHLGWPATASQAIKLAPGMYRLSYKASSTGPLNVTVQPKVGLAVSPYTADFPTGDAVTDPVSTALQSFTHTFTTTMMDAQAGLAFSVAPGNNGGMTTVCFDDVALQLL